VRGRGHDYEAATRLVKKRKERRGGCSIREGTNVLFGVGIGRRWAIREERGKKTAGSGRRHTNLGARAKRKGKKEEKAVITITKGGGGGGG